MVKYTTLGEYWGICGISHFAPLDFFRKCKTVAVKEYYYSLKPERNIVYQSLRVGEYFILLISSKYTFVVKIH